MSGRAPILGVTGPDCGGEAAWLFTQFSVLLAGGRAVRITPRRFPRMNLSNKLVKRLDGLIIGGGADIDPNLYGQELLHITARKRPQQPLGGYLLSLIVLPL